MSGESNSGTARFSRRTLGTLVPTIFGGEKLSKFGLVCAVLWPHEKPDMVISQRAGCSDRAARQYIRGDRDPSLDALLVVLNEIRGERRK